MTPIPSAKLLIRKRTADEYVLLRQAPLLRNSVYMGNVAVGPMVKMDRAEFVQKGWQIIRDYLYDFGVPRDLEKSEFDLLGRAEQKHYKEKYLDVLFSLQTPFVVRIDNDDSSKYVTVSADCDAAQLVQVLDALLEK